AGQDQLLVDAPARYRFDAPDRGGLGLATRRGVEDDLIGEPARRRQRRKPRFDERHGILEGTRQVAPVRPRDELSRDILLERDTAGATGRGNVLQQELDAVAQAALTPVSR